MRSSLLVLAACCWCSPQTCFALGGSTCATAPLIYTVPYSDSGQLDSGLDPNCPGQPVNDLFYRFDPQMDGVYRFDMCGSNSCCFQQMRIWTGGTCCSGASVTVDNGCVDGYPQYDLAMTSGQVVYIEVGKSGGEWAIAPLYQFNVTVAVDSCPAPDSLVIYTVGDNVVLTWSAADCDTPLYTIYRSATSDVQIIPANEIATTTTTTYTDPGILGGPGDKSFYAVTATN